MNPEQRQAFTSLKLERIAALIIVDGLLQFMCKNNKIIINSSQIVHEIVSCISVLALNRSIPEATIFKTQSDTATCFSSGLYKILSARQLLLFQRLEKSKRLINLVSSDFN